jgi:hypothetical protein
MQTKDKVLAELMAEHIALKKVGASAGVPRGSRLQAGSRQTATPESPPANRVKSEAARRDVG